MTNVMRQAQGVFKVYNLYSLAGIRGRAPHASL